MHTRTSAKEACILFLASIVLATIIGVGGVYYLNKQVGLATADALKPVIQRHVKTETIIPPMTPNKRVENGFWPYQKHPKPEFLWASARMNG